MARYEPNHRGTGRMLKGPEFKDLVMDAAEHGASAARVAAPIDDGELAGSIHVEYHGDNGGPAFDRVEARIIADAPHAAAVAFGTKHTPPNPYMQTAIDAIEGVK